MPGCSWHELCKKTVLLPNPPYGRQEIMSNVERFYEVYARLLPEMRKAKPEAYAWPESEMLKVLERMRRAFESGSFNHDGDAIKATCKELGIKYTRKSILEYLKGGPK
jgi:hypothetical protein